MSTAAPAITRTHRDTVLYPNAHWYFLAAIVTTWIGFSRSYFLRIGHATIFQHAHGATAGLWMLLLVVQPILYQRGELTLHRRLGRLGVFILVPLLVMGGALMLHNMIKHQTGANPEAVYTLGYLDLWALFMFPLFVVLAIYYARYTDLHARYMVCTVLELLPPALTRALTFVPWVANIAKSVDIAYGLMVVILLLLLRDDLRKGRLRAPYLVALALYLPMVLTMNHAAHWHWWHKLADRYASF
jgi:hypothetical protein